MTGADGLVLRLERRLSAPAVALPPSERWSELNPAEDEFRRVKFSAAFDPGAEVLVYTTGSTVRPDVAEPGYWAEWRHFSSNWRNEGTVTSTRWKK